MLGLFQVAFQWLFSITYRSKSIMFIGISIVWVLVCSIHGFWCVCMFVLTASKADLWHDLMGTNNFRHNASTFDHSLFNRCMYVCCVCHNRF